MDIAVKTYLDSVPNSRRERLLSVRERILKLHPNVDESMDYKMPTYRDAVPEARTAWVLYPGTRFRLFGLGAGLVEEYAATSAVVDGVGAVPLGTAEAGDALSWVVGVLGRCR